MPGSRSSSVAMLRAFNVANRSYFFKMLRSASLSLVGFNAKPHTLLLLSSSIRSQLILTAQIIRPIYKISPIVFTSSAVFYDAATHSHQQQQHISRTLCTNVASSPFFDVCCTPRTEHVTHLACDKTASHRPSACEIGTSSYWFSFFFACRAASGWWSHRTRPTEQGS